MKNLKKYFAVLTVLVFTPLVVNAEVSVKDTTSYEFIRNQGYSDEVHRIIETKTKDPVAPLEKETRTKANRFGWYVLDTIDSSYNKPDKFVDHNIDFSKSLDDL